MNARHARGFTLLEVLVAFGLLAAALAILLGTLSGSVRQVRHSGDASRAALYAQTLLDQVGVGEVLAAGERGGDLEDGKYRWTLQVSPWRDPTATPAAGPPPVGAPRLMDVTLRVEWGDGGPRRQLEVRTLRLVTPGVDGSLVP